MKEARATVNDIVKEIEKRVSSPDSDEALFEEFQVKQKEIEERVSQDFSIGVPRRHISRIRKILGNDFIDFLNKGKKGLFAWKGRDQLRSIYQKLASLLELYLYYEKEAQGKTLEVERLRKIKQELIESQISHVNEVEMLEAAMGKNKMLLDFVLMPFEDATKRILSFLKVKQLKVFLFDDDKFLATEMKTDGETFIYNQEEEMPDIPEAVSEVKLKEVKETTLDVPLNVEGEQIGHCRFERQAHNDFDIDKWREDVELITPLLARIIKSNSNLVLANKVYIDDLTQMYNKRKLNEQMGKLFKQFKRGDKELHIAMIDIDKFKVLNDTYGHPVGDEILKQTAVILKEEIQYAYRYGGEEFAGVFYGDDKDKTLEIMERLRKRIEKNPYVIKGQAFSITVSAGISKFETYMNSVMDAIDRADKALYASKEDGRNRCTYYDDVKGRLSSEPAVLRQEIMKLKAELSKKSQKNKKEEKIKK